MLRIKWYETTLKKIFILYFKYLKQACCTAFDKHLMESIWLETECVPGYWWRKQCRGSNTSRGVSVWLNVYVLLYVCVSRPTKQTVEELFHPRETSECTFWWNQRMKVRYGQKDPPVGPNIVRKMFLMKLVSLISFWFSTFTQHYSNTRHFSEDHCLCQDIIWSPL